MPHEQPSEAMACLTGGPPIDWGSAFAQHERWLRTVVHARVGEAQAVGDVMQEVWLAAVRQRTPLAGPTKMAPWLYRVAVRQSLLYRRRQGRHRRLIDRFAQRSRSRAAPSPETDPLEWLLADERRELVRAALGRLPGRDAEILLLKYTENWRYSQLAEHLGVSRSAVEARLHRARARLRIALGSREPSYGR